MPVWDRRWPAHLNLLNLTKELLQVHRLGQERRHELASWERVVPKTTDWRSFDPRGKQQAAAAE